MMPGPRCWQICWGRWPGAFPGGRPCSAAVRWWRAADGAGRSQLLAVTLTYATGRGHALIGRALYLPEGCAADEEYRELAGVPEEVMFATKPQLAGALLD